jgi:hypothetical protein
MVAKATNACKCMKAYYEHSIPPTCFSHHCHEQRGVLQRMIRQKFLNQWIDVKHYVLKIHGKFKIQIKNMDFKPRILKPSILHMCTGSHPFVHSSMYPSFVTHVPEDGHEWL